MGWGRARDEGCKSEAILGVLPGPTGKDSCPSLSEAQAEVRLEVPPLGKRVWMTEVGVTLLEPLGTTMPDVNASPFQETMNIGSAEGYELGSSFSWAKPPFPVLRRELKSDAEARVTCFAGPGPGKPLPFASCFSHGGAEGAGDLPTVTELLGGSWDSDLGLFPRRLPLSLCSTGRGSGA